jgi:putative flippase GtrA
MKQKTHLTGKDLLFGGINGLIFGLLLPIVLRDFNITNQPPYLITALFFVILAVVGVYIGYQLSKIKQFFFQLAKFGATGAANFALDIGVLSVLIFIFFPQENATIPTLFYASFKATSFIVANINSYLWNKFWSFQDNDKKNTLKEFGKFILVSSIGLAINASVATLTNSLQGTVGIDPKTWAAISAIVASVVGMGWNFLGYKFLVFKK